MPKITFDISQDKYDKIIQHGKDNGRNLAAEVRFGINYWIKNWSNKK